jgi:anti-anti-sigma factor
LEIVQVNYRITEVNDWVIVHPSGKAQNNEPLRVKYLFHRWLTQNGIRVIVSLKDLSQLGAWEMRLLRAFKEEVTERTGILRLCNLSPSVGPSFKNDYLGEEFEVYQDLERAMEGEGNPPNRAQGTCVHSIVD